MEILSSGTLCLGITESTMVAEARRRVAYLAESLRFTETQAGRVAIIATELVTNLVKHGGGGELYAAADETASGIALDLLAVDRGRGMADINACLRDGYSTAGSPGTGLGALTRLSSRYDIQSAVGQGTVVHARVSSTEGPEVPARSEIFGLSLPHPGEDVVGDGWARRQTEAGAQILVVDGLGHGQLAADASAEAITAFQRMSLEASPAHILEEIHLSLRSTRGAVAAVATIDLDRATVTYGGIGNISAMIIGATETKRLLSHNGTLGSQARRFQQLVYPFHSGSLLLLYSDGLASQVDIVKYSGLGSHSAAVIAGVLMRDFRRGRDDATIVAAREYRDSL